MNKKKQKQKQKAFWRYPFYSFHSCCLRFSSAYLYKSFFFSLSLFLSLSHLSSLLPISYAWSVFPKPCFRYLFLELSTLKWLSVSLILHVSPWLTRSYVICSVPFQDCSSWFPSHGLRAVLLRVPCICHIFFSIASIYLQSSLWKIPLNSHSCLPSCSI